MPDPYWDAYDAPSERHCKREVSTMRKAAAAELLGHGYVIDVSKPFHITWWA